jgi:hypothetical protein
MIVTLLEPFAVQTKDSYTIFGADRCPTIQYSVIVHNNTITILNLECHLQQSSAPKTLTSKLLTDFRCRFAFILDQDSINFNPLPAAACLLDPSLADVLLSPDLSIIVACCKNDDPEIIWARAVLIE